VDVPAVEAVSDLHQRLAADGVELWLCHLQPGAREILDRAGVLAAIGPDRIHPRVTDGILAFALRSPGSGERVAVFTELIGYIRERAARPGTSPEAVELLATLEDRLTLELAAAGGSETARPAGPR